MSNESASQKRGFAYLVVLVLTFTALPRIADHYIGVATRSIGWYSSSDQWKVDAAKDAVKELRDGDWYPEYTIEKIDRAFDSYISYKSIGTTEKEVLEFRSGEPKRIRAKKDLARIRLKEDPLPSIKTFIEQLKKANIRPEEIGTTTEELEGYQKATEKALYEHSLESLKRLANGMPRYYDDVVHSHVDYLAERVLEAPTHVVSKNDPFNFTLEELGTTVKEIKDLQKKAHKSVERILKQRKIDYAP